MGSLIDLFKFLWENKLVSILPGVAALMLTLNHQVFEVTGLKDDVNDLVATSNEARLDRNYTLLCMSPGNPDILSRINELQRRHVEVTGSRYNPLPCDLLLASQ